jgi:hypothetical protein
MTQRTANIAEVCRFAISEDTQHFSNDIPALRRAAVTNVKNVIIRQRKTNAIMAEWMIAKEEAKRWSLRK